MVGGIAVSRSASSHCTNHLRRNDLLRIRLTERVRQTIGNVVLSPVAAQGAVLHYTVVFADGRAKGVSLVAGVKSATHRRGRFGCTALRHGIPCIIGIDGELYVPGALEGMARTLEREGVHSILYDREPFSGEP